MATSILIGIVCMAIGAGIALAMHTKASKTARESEEEILRGARKEAENLIKEAKLQAKEEVIRVRDEFEKVSRERRSELQEQEKRVLEKETHVERKMDVVQNLQKELTERERNVAAESQKVRDKQKELDDLLKKEWVQLEGVAQMTRDQARVQLMQRLDHELTNEKGTLIRKAVDEIQQKSTREAQKVIIQAMQRFAGECAYERTTATVSLPSDDMKGRIIGREGRNIRVFEAETGVNVLIDDTPSAVVITCFDPRRLEVARIALEKLVEDGRIHPTRVEEVVANAKKDLHLSLIAAGEDAVHELQLSDVPPPVIEVLGKLKFRYSYSQNVLRHSIEVAKFMGIIAAELGLNVDKAKRMGLFHDIGKALDDEIEGPHALIGKEFLKRAGEDAEVINGVGCHHGEIPAETPLASLVSVCDAMSASRPGARSETSEFYIKRLEDLETIGRSCPGVESCYAVQAGRELRVIVEPDKVSENEAFNLSREIVKKIESQMQFPGQIKVCVIRETRAVEYAK